MRVCRGQRCTRREGGRAFPGVLLVTLAVLSFAAATRAAHAEDAVKPQEPQFGWREMWGGADATKDVWLLYTGVTLAPLSKDIYGIA